ncbi:MAG: tetratricopeptide repeat protein [Myxococcota bacterium]
MTRDELKHAFREATASPPPFAKERVWQRLAEPRAPRRSALFPALVLAASVLVGVVGTRVALTRDSAGQWSEGRSAAVWTAARVERTGHTLVLERGELAVSSWGTPVEVRAAAHRVVVERGVAIIRVAGDSVTAELVEGALLFDGETRTAPLVAKTALSEQVVRLEPEETAGARLSARAERAEAEQRFEEAAKAWAELASSGSLDAEVANFKQGEVELRQLRRPEAALATFEAGEARHPAGALTQERQLSAIESCVALGRWPDVEARTSAFLTRHPRSERADEVRVLHARALLARGAKDEACAALASLPGQAAETLRAQCR